VACVEGQAVRIAAPNVELVVTALENVPAAHGEHTLSVAPAAAAE
jgi:hypothetical protein